MLIFTFFILISCFSGSHITFPSLKYKYEDLEPNISSTIMEDHHKLHHKGYVINYNKLIDRLRIENAKGVVYFIIAIV